MRAPAANRKEVESRSGSRLGPLMVPSWPQCLFAYFFECGVRVVSLPVSLRLPCPLPPFLPSSLPPSSRPTSLQSTEVEVFMWTRADSGGEPSRRNKKARDFTQLFFHKSTLLSTAGVGVGKVVFVFAANLLSLSSRRFCPALIILFSLFFLAVRPSVRPPRRPRAETNEM